MRYEVTLDDRRVRVELGEDGRFTVGDRVVAADVRAVVVDERALRAGRGAAGLRTGRVELRAPMPGLLKAVHVKEGDRVDADAPLATLEAMKMENELLAPSAGRIAKVRATAGAKVEAGAVLIVIASE